MSTAKFFKSDSGVLMVEVTHGDKDFLTVAASDEHKMAFPLVWLKYLKDNLADDEIVVKSTGAPPFAIKKPAKKKSKKKSKKK